MPQIAVAILNWNGKHHLEKFLPSVVKFSKGADIYVIDNCSSDDSIAFLEANFKSIRLIQLDKNYGFCDGYNHGLKQITSDYYVILNSDVEVTENWLKAPIKLLESRRDIAACQPKLLSYNSPQLLEYAGAAGGLIDSLGYPFCRGRIFEVVEENTPEWNDEKEVFWASGACLFIRSSLFHEIGGFESLFFAHMEEIDLCWRLRNAGFKIYYTGLSTVLHLGGGTLNNTNPRKTFLNYRNGLSLLYKNLPFRELYIKILIRMVLDGVAALRYLARREYGNFSAVFRAHMAFYALIPKLRRKRIYTNNSNGILKGLIIWHFFIKKRHKFKEVKHYIS